MNPNKSPAGFNGTEDSDKPSFAYAEFTPVKPRKSRKNNKRTILKDRMGPPPLQVLQWLRENLCKDDDDWFSKASRLLSDSLTELSLQCGAIDHDKLRVLCLGLGSPTNSQNSNAQLAFMLEIAKHLNLTSDRISLYDPVFTEKDRIMFEQLNLTVLHENQDGRYPLDEPTLCFMLHCDKELYNSILEANWNERGGLKNFILVGNRLSEYVDSNPSQRLKMTVPYLFEIASKLQCHALSPSKQWPTAFNNTCVQYLPADIELEAVLASIQQKPNETPSEAPISKVSESKLGDGINGTG